MSVFKRDALHQFSIQFGAPLRSNYGVARATPPSLREYGRLRIDRNILRHMSPACYRLSRSNISTWQVFLCLTVLAFLCRALVPMGYMPGSAGAEQGKLALTLCVPGGVQTVMVDLADPNTHHSSQDQLQLAACPYALVVSQAMLPPAGELAPLGDVGEYAVARSSPALAPPPTLPFGPPLGSRAPPSLLG